MEIAQALGIAYKTVANSCSVMKTKLGVARTADLIRVSIDLKRMPAASVGQHVGTAAKKMPPSSKR